MSKGHTPAASKTGVGYGVLAILCGVAGSLSYKLLDELPLSQDLVERSLVKAAVLSV